jgi:Predicted archaeal sugar kinases
MPFPDRWRVLVVLDARRHGAHGTDEAAAFAGLPPASDADAGHLCRLLVMKLLPAVAELDLAAFGSALEELQSRLGEYFAPAQGGHRFVSADVAAATRIAPARRCRGHWTKLLGANRLRIRAFTRNGKSNSG